jgi:hypothetical protein
MSIHTAEPDSEDGFLLEDADRLEHLDDTAEDMSGLNPFQAEEKNYLDRKKWREVDWRDVLDAEFEKIRESRRDPYEDRGFEAVISTEDVIEGVEHILSVEYQRPDDVLTVSAKDTVLYQETGVKSPNERVEYLFNISI